MTSLHARTMAVTATLPIADETRLVALAATLEMPSDLPIGGCLFGVTLDGVRYVAEAVGVPVADLPADASGYLDLEGAYLQVWGARVTRVGSTLHGFIRWNRHDPARSAPTLGIFALERPHSGEELVRFDRALSNAAGVIRRGRRRLGLESPEMRDAARALELKAEHPTWSMGKIARSVLNSTYESRASDARRLTDWIRLYRERLATGDYP